MGIDIQSFKHKNYFDKSKDGLLQDWQDNICFMNPPYGREIKHWITHYPKSSEEFLGYPPSSPILFLTQIREKRSPLYHYRRNQRLDQNHKLLML